MASGPPSHRRRLRNRRGAIVVWFGMTITLLLLVTALVVDYAYWYTGLTQLQTAADAAAMRGAKMLQISTAGTHAGLEADVDSAAVNFSPSNSAQTFDVTIDSTQVRLAWWPMTPPGGVPPEPILDRTSAAWPNDALGAKQRANAVVVTNRQTGSRIVGRIFNLAAPSLGRRAVAWVANLNASRCVRPWGIPMNLVTRMATGGTESSFRVLNGSEIVALDNLRDVDRTVILVPPSKTWPNGYTPPSASMGEWAGIRFDREATTTGNQGMDEFRRLSAGGCMASGDAFGVGDYARTDLPANSLPNFMQGAIENGENTGGGTRLSETCHFAPGRANCYATAAAAAAGSSDTSAFGVTVPVAYTSVPSFNGSEPIVAYMLGQFRLMCVYGSTNRPETETCDWTPPGSTPGFLAGTIVGYLQPSFFERLRPDAEWGNGPSTSQRLLLVK